MRKLNIYLDDIRSGVVENIVITNFDKNTTVKDLLVLIFSELFNDVKRANDYSLYTEKFRLLPITKRLNSIKGALILRTKDSLL